MRESMLSVGIDLGTTTTQMVVSRLDVENKASAFSVPHMEICGREILFRSQVHFTPLVSQDTLDAETIKRLIEEEYRRAGITPEEVQTGAVIITGETARKENAKLVLEALADLAGKFVVATAGPALESVLAARGAGADRYAREHGVHVLHFDIGGGTSNLALFGPDGTLLDTGCFNVGGRLMKFNESGTVIYRSPVLKDVDTLLPGEKATPENLCPLLDTLVQVLEEAAGLLPQTELLRRFRTDRIPELPDAPLVLSFSGGVANLIQSADEHWLRYGDLGVLLGRAIQRSKLCQVSYVLGRETLQATVVGAGSYSTELSGSTVDHAGVDFPLQDLPVITVGAEESAGSQAFARAIEKKLTLIPEGPVALGLRGSQSPSYAQVQRMAEGIAQSMQTRSPVVVVLEQDMAKALGHALRGRLAAGTPVICLDGISVQEGSYLDIAAPVGGGAALPVVVKTLALG